METVETRIALRCHLEALIEEQTGGYRRRLELGGSEADALFPDTAIAVIYHHFRGILRLIDTPCENALLNAYGRTYPSDSRLR